MEIRELKEDDFFKGYIDLINELSPTIDNINYNQFKEHINKINSKIFVIENNGKIICSGSIFIEHKFIHNLKSVGHIEDIIVSKEYRGKGIGLQIINYLSEYAKNNNCYKIILSCSTDNIKFYEKCNFINKEHTMMKYYN